MSSWTYITGVITVYPMGRTQPEKRYILDTILEHMPRVTGSEQDMYYHVVEKSGYSTSCSHNEFDEPIWRTRQKRFWTRMQDEYFVIVEGSLRDRYFEDTLRELNNWLNRLAKRAGIEEILVKLSGRSNNDYRYKEIIISNAKPYKEMAEWPSWSDKANGEPMWCEYLMWDCAKDTRYPILLQYKYYNDPENDAEAERRLRYGREELYDNQ